MAPPSIPIPDIPGLPSKSDPNFGHLLIKDDTLYQKDGTLYSSRDLHVRIALFVIVQAVPILSSLILTFSRKAWWKMKWFWTMSRLVVLWLISIQIVAAVVYTLEGATTRVLFITATFHLQIEYIIIAFLLGAPPLVGLGAAYIAGCVLLSVQLLVTDLSVVYIITTIFGFSDIMIPLLFVYGKQWLYATGGVAHFVQAVAVFSVIVKDYGHPQYTAITFLSTMIMNGVLVTALVRAIKEPRATIGPIRLGNGEDHGAPNENPLAGINIPRNTLILLFGASVVGGIASAFIFTFAVAGN